jgi:hypothetical protein
MTVTKDYSLLGCDVIYSGRSLSALWMNVLLPYSVKETTKTYGVTSQMRGKLGDIFVDGNTILSY